MQDATEELWECGYLQLVLLRDELLPVVEPLVPEHLPHHRDNGQWSVSPFAQHNPPPNARYLDITTPVSASSWQMFTLVSAAASGTLHNFPPVPQLSTCCVQTLASL